jgi:hypothetical protein
MAADLCSGSWCLRLWIVGSSIESDGRYREVVEPLVLRKHCATEHSFILRFSGAQSDRSTVHLITDQDGWYELVDEGEKKFGEVATRRINRR